MHGLQISTLRPVRTKVLIMLLVVYLLVAGGIVIRSDLGKRSQEIKAAKHNALLLVRSLAARQEKIEDETKKMLMTLAQSPIIQKLDVKGSNDLFNKLKGQHPYYSVFGAITPDGDLFAASEPLEPGSINILNQKHVQDAIKTRDFSAGEYTFGRVTGAKTIYYGYPVLDPDKNLTAVVTAGFMLDQYASLIKKANMPVDPVVVITDSKGIRLYRSPENNVAALGQPIPGDAFKRISGDLDEGVFEGVGSNGKYRLNAFKRLHLRQNLPPYLYMLVGYTKDKIIQNADFMMYSTLFILGISGFAVFALAWALTGFGSKVD